MHDFSKAEPDVEARYMGSDLLLKYLGKCEKLVFVTTIS
jgi:hypothetical protein